MESFAILNFPLHLIKFDLQLCIPLIVSWRSKKKEVKKRPTKLTINLPTSGGCFATFTFFCEPSVDETFHPFFCFPHWNCCVDDGGEANERP